MEMRARRATPSCATRRPPGAVFSQADQLALARQAHALEDELITIGQLAAEYPDDSDLSDLIGDASGRLEALLSPSLVSGPHSSRPAILTIRAGAGGADARDWVAQVLSMYVSWAEGGRRVVETLDLSPGEEGGLRQAVIRISTHDAYGLLRAEAGIHRVSHLSRFGSQGKRQTSFCAVEVIPEIAPREVGLRDADLRVDTYRGTGPGGQHRNKTDSAVRITHLPTGLQAQASTDRSQSVNRRTALSLLASRLSDLERQQHEQMVRGLGTEVGAAQFGQRKRSYVLHPYRSVVDHESGHRERNAGALDGCLDGFLAAGLRQQLLAA